MAENEKVTTRLEVDVTDFKKGLSDANRYIRLANSEFDKATAGVGKWSDSADGLRAKLTQLERTLEGQEAAASVLRAEYERVCQEQGENSKGAQELAIKLNKQEAACKKTKAQIDHYKNSLDDMEENTDKAGDESKKLGGNLDDVADSAKKADNATDGLGDGLAKSLGSAATAAGKLAGGLAKAAGKAITTGLKALAATSGALVTAFLATSESSKEWTANMNKLNAVAKDAGRSVIDVKDQFREFYGILGDEGLATTTVSNLEAIGLSQENLASVTNSMAGIWAKYGDSIPLDGLAEAILHSSSLGSVQGNLADALEWQGITVDDFNKKLEKCSTEQERQQLIVETLDGLYGKIGETYKETNADIIASNEATAKLNDTLAEIGTVATPIVTTFKNLGTSILNQLMPNIRQLASAFTGLMAGEEGAADRMGKALSNILQTLGQKLLSILPTIITVGTSVIESLIKGIIEAAPTLASGAGKIVDCFLAAAPQLLQAGAGMITKLVQGLANSLPKIMQQAGSIVKTIMDVLQTNLPLILQAGGQMVSQLLTGIVNNLPAMAQGAMNAISSFAESFKTNLPIILEKGKELLANLGQGIKDSLPGLVDQALDALMSFATTLYDNAPTIIDAGFDLLSNLVQGILDSLPTLLAKGPEIISKFANIINDNFPKILKKGVELLGQIIKGLIQAIPTLIANIPKIITAFLDVWEAFNWLNLGKKAITFLKDGALKMVGAVKTAGKNIANSLTNIIKELPGKLLELGKSAITKLGSGIKSMASGAASAGKAVFNGILNFFKTLPSKLLSVGKDLIKGLWNGISNMTGWIVNKIKGFGDSILGGIKSFFGINSPSKVMRDEVGKWLPVGMADGIEKNTKAATKAMTGMARKALGAANAELSGGSLNVPGVNGTGAAGRSGTGGPTYVFNQYNNSPKALTRAEIYRQTNNQLKFATSQA